MSSASVAVAAATAKTKPAAPHLDYRPDVDGLRAVAVLPVVIFHAFPELIPGGFVGVDIFFVISGFLITGILLRALNKGEFSLLGFYGRRIKRIFPALIAMMLTVFALGWAVLLPDEFEQLGKHIAAGAAFVLNLSLFIDTNLYFGAIEAPLVHLWSLGVEEQFYFVWPLLLWATWRLGRWQVALLAAISAVSFYLNVSSVHEDPLQAFYLPSSRLWELALGGLLAFATQNKAAHGGHEALPAWVPRAGLFGDNARANLGAVLLLGSFAFLHNKMEFPGWWALAPVFGSVLLISAGPDSFISRRVLSQRWMVFVGLISYPLYLWHWPLLSLAHTMDWRDYTPALRVGLVALSVLLAWLTYRFIERPLRGSPKTFKVAGGLFATMAVCALGGWLTYKTQIPSRPIPADVAKILAAENEDFPYPEEPGILNIGDGAKKVLFIGDSTLAQYHGRVEKVLKENPGNSRGAIFAWRPGCAPHDEITRVAHAKCRQLLADAIALAKTDPIESVVIGFSWYSYLTGNRDSDHVGEVRPLLPVADPALDNVRRMVEGFAASGKKVYIVLNAPLNPGFAPRQMVQRTLFAPGFKVNSPPATKESLLQAYEPFLARLRQIAKDNNASLIDPLSGLCPDGVCRSITKGDEPIYRDTFHLRKFYILESVGYIDPVVLDASHGPVPGGR
ncbi:acyltransferase [Lysobacter sp. K5869]|uniref:acyltransferase family protein n=1 Tax=Lysobacter sp. K5869 TaxID=2820808 RepID=UPI001C05EE81|nr:acyltransferase family protein [Lysobacter sp. K5869]QWP77556.1 acyltransferase [Lysobacter sp. K5869]